MKKILVLSAIFIFALSQVSFAQLVGGGSGHDFTNAANTTNWNSLSSNQACGPCHTPHNALTTATAVAPLWSHAETSAATTGYSSSTMNATTGAVTGISLLCLGCHDGSEALNNHVGGTATAYRINNGVLGGTNVGSDLSNDHPVAFTYNTALASADGGLVDPSSAGSSGLGSTIDADMLFSGQMECSSCHDPHDELKLGSLLRKSNANSGLCTTCHTK